MIKGNLHGIMKTALATIFIAGAELTCGPDLTQSLGAQKHETGKCYKRGMTGEKISSLVIALNSSDYLNADEVTRIHDNFIYDETVERAVSHFQHDLGLRPDGVYNSNLDEILYTFWRPELTSFKLGTRTYSAANPKAGADVDLLIEILNEAGFPPDVTKLTLSDSIEFSDRVKNMFVKAGVTNGEAIAGQRHHYYSKDIEKALMAFQAFNGIKPSGKLNAVTLRALSEKYLKTKERKPSSYDARPTTRKSTAESNQP